MAKLVLMYHPDLKDDDGNNREKLVHEGLVDRVAKSGWKVRKQRKAKASTEETD